MPDGNEDASKRGQTYFNQIHGHNTLYDYEKARALVITTQVGSGVFSSTITVEHYIISMLARRDTAIDRGDSENDKSPCPSSRFTLYTEAFSCKQLGIKIGPPVDRFSSIRGAVVRGIGIRRTYE